MNKESLIKFWLPLMKIATPAMLGAIGAAFLIIYPEGYAHFCGAR